MIFNFTESSLTKREFDVMSILWESETALVASEIAKRGNGLTVNTVQAVLKKLLKKELIVIDQIVYSGTVLTRSYKPTVSAEDFEMNHLVSAFQRLPQRPSMTSHFVAALLEQEKDSDRLVTEIEQLEGMLQEKREQVHQRNSKNKKN